MPSAAAHPGPPPMRFASPDDSGGGLGLVALLVFKCEIGRWAKSAASRGKSPNHPFCQVKSGSREFDEVWLISKHFDVR
jgi:hypothetical protein